MKRVVFVVGALVISGWAAYAADAPLDLVKYRQTIMGDMGKHMRASGMIAKGLVSRPGDLVGHAEAIHAGSVGLVDLFPAGSGPNDLPKDVKDAHTGAKAEIWTDHDKFAADAKTFEEATAKLVDVAKTGDLAAYTAQSKVVGDACGACHDSFKAKD